MTYRLSGTFLEACDCKTLCPCWVGQPPDQDICNGIFAWTIEAGEISGHPAAGLRVVSVSHHEGSRQASQQSVAIFIDVDDAADDETRAWLSDPARIRLAVATFSGSNGGELAGLGKLLGQVVNVADDTPDDDLVDLVHRRISYTVGVDGRRTTHRLTVSSPEGREPELVTVESATLPSEDPDHDITLDYSSLSTTLGRPAKVGQASRFSLYVPGFAPEFWLDIDLQDRSVTTGAFTYGS